MSVSYLATENGELRNVTSDALRVQGASFRTKQVMEIGAIYDNVRKKLTG